MSVPSGRREDRDVAMDGDIAVDGIDHFKKQVTLAVKMFVTTHGEPMRSMGSPCAPY